MDTCFQPLNSVLTIGFICCSRLSVDISQKRGKFFEESFPPPKNVFGLHNLHCCLFCCALYGICVTGGMERARIRGTHALTRYEEE